MTNRLGVVEQQVVELDGIPETNSYQVGVVLEGKELDLLDQLVESDLYLVGIHSQISSKSRKQSRKRRKFLPKSFLSGISLAKNVSPYFNQFGRPT